MEHGSIVGQPGQFQGVTDVQTGTQDEQILIDEEQDTVGPQKQVARTQTLGLGV